MVVDTHACRSAVADIGDLSAFQRRGVIGSGSLREARGDIGRLDDDGEHAWTSTGAIRADVVYTVDEHWTQRLDDMIAYAPRKGWIDNDGFPICGHVMRLD